jgi:hypothetical protein
MHGCADLKNRVMEDNLQPPPISIHNFSVAHISHPLGHLTSNQGLGALVFGISFSVEPDLGQRQEGIFEISRNYATG